MILNVQSIFKLIYLLELVFLGNIFAVYMIVLKESGSNVLLPST